MVPYVLHAVIENADLPSITLTWSPLYLTFLAGLVVAGLANWIRTQVQLSRATSLASDAYPRAEVDNRIRQAVADCEARREVALRKVEERTNEALTKAQAASVDVDRTNLSVASMHNSFTSHKEHVLQNYVTRGDHTRLEDKLGEKLDWMHEANQKSIQALTSRLDAVLNSHRERERDAA